MIKYITLFIAILVISCSTTKDGTGDLPRFRLLSSGVSVKDIKVGEGKEISLGQTLKMKYIAKTTSGIVFENFENSPRKIQYTNTDLMKGMFLGLKGMRVGGIREIMIPPEYGFGNRQVLDVPANSTLLIKVEVIEILSE